MRRRAWRAKCVQGYADLRLLDYRDVTGQFDRIASIEMIEAVGERYWPAYFAKLRACLARGGVAVLQAITISEGRFADYRNHPTSSSAISFRAACCRHARSSSAKRRAPG